ncbi:MAG: RNA polymerase sigma factor [Acidimicrobiia bacterium]|jgi:RNA polymerase sigma factor (sigma-70 family)
MRDATARVGPVFSLVMDDLCRRLADDLDGAFPDVVRLLQDDVVSGLRRLHGPEAEDLAQEALIRAYRALRGYEPERIRSLRLRGWIWTIALNLGRNRVRDASRRPVPVPLEDRHPVEDPDPVDAGAWDRRMAGLPLAQRQAVVLRHVVGLTYAEIAGATGRPEGTVKADVHRGLERLRATMEAER